MALAAVAIPHLLHLDPQVIGGLPFFPGGLVELLHRAGLCCDRNNGLLYTFLGWMLYVPLCIALLVIDDKRIFFRFFVLLCGLLALNVAGCYVTLNEEGGI